MSDRDSPAHRVQLTVSTAETSCEAATGRRHWARRMLLWSGWLLPQFLLLGPALVGRAVLAPVGLLQLPGFYPLQSATSKTAVHQDWELYDLVTSFPAARHFAAMEFRAGHLPIWQPANFAGAPFAPWHKYSPFELLYDLLPSSITLAWSQLLQSLLFGVGVWLFLRRGLTLSYWPSALVAWCAPLTGYATLWQGYPVVLPVYWLPWMLLLVRESVARPWSWCNCGLVGVTALMLFCGGLDVCGLVFITTGLYGLWLLEDERLRRGWMFALSSFAGLSAAYLLGVVLAAAFLLPVVEYVRTGSRMQQRGAGAEERPPEGVQALAPVVLPNAYGSSRPGSYRMVDNNRLESSSSAYTGLLAAFWLAPLAWCDAKRRRETQFFAMLAFLAMGWALDLPGLVEMMRQKPLNMLSWNRWVFATSMSILVTAAIGLEQLRGGAIRFRRWFLIPIAASALFGCYCLIRTFVPPEPLATRLEAAIRLGRGDLSLDELQAARTNFMLCYALGAALSLAAVIGWLSAIVSGVRFGYLRAVIIAMLPAELIWFSAHELRQGDPSLYFPRIPALQKIPKIPPVRVWGIGFLQPELNLFHGLEDVRGYDGVDPALFVRLFNLACNPAAVSETYAVTASAIPKTVYDGSRAKLHPVADLLNVRYILTDRLLDAELPVVWHWDNFWILENRDALPRAFVPHSARFADSDAKALAVMASDVFRPAEVILLSTKLDLPSLMDGRVMIRSKSATRMSLDVDMRTDGIVVVSEMWDSGWRGQLDGSPCAIERVDVALRGVRVPAGKHSVVLTYDPSSVRCGLQITGAGVATWIAWMIGLWATSVCKRRRTSAITNDSRNCRLAQL
jgi:hypothetical protein